MRIKLLVAAAGFAAFATPSLAAEFYIVQDTTTKRCTIVEQRPTTQTFFYLSAAVPLSSSIGSAAPGRVFCYGLDQRLERFGLRRGSNRVILHNGDAGAVMRGDVRRP